MSTNGTDAPRAQWSHDSVNKPSLRADRLIRLPEDATPSARRAASLRAWLMVAVVAISLTIASGARFVFGVVLKPLSEQFGWGRAELTGAVTVSMIVLSICQPLVGYLVDRVSPKRVLVAGLALLGLALIPFTFATEIWQIYLLYGVLTSFGLAAASPVLATTIIGRWFTDKRALALSMATSGSAFGQLLIVPIAAWIVIQTDWETAYRVMAIALLVIAVPLTALVLRDAPSPQVEVPAAEAVDAKPGVTLREALLHPTFWILGFGFLVCGWTMAFPNTHFLAYADDMGMSIMHAANTVSVTAIFSVIGSLILGIAADRTQRTGVLALTYALRGVAFALLLLLPGGNLLYVYGMVLGISWTSTTPLTAAIAADRYGPRHLGVIFGTMYTFMNLGYGAAALLDGVIFESTGSYDRALDLNVLLGLVAAAGVALVPYLGAERILPARLRPARQKQPLTA
jgi:MFS family permease